MAELYRSVAASPPLAPTAEAATDALQSTVDSDAAFQESAKVPFPRQHEVDKTYHSKENTNDNEITSADQPLEFLQPLHIGPTATTSVVSAHSDLLENECGDTAKIKESSEHTWSGGAPVDGVSGDGVDSSVLAPYLSVGMRSLHYTPCGTYHVDPAAAATAFSSKQQQQEDGIACEDSRSTVSSDALAATVAHAHDEAHNNENQPRLLSEKLSPSRESGCNEGDQQNVPQTTLCKQPRSHESHDDVEKEEGMPNALMECAPASANSVAVSRLRDVYSSSSNISHVHSNASHALAAVNSCPHDATASDAKDTMKLPLSPRLSYVPWRLSVSNGCDDDGQVSLPSFDTKHASVVNEQRARSLPQPNRRTRSGAANNTESNSGAHEDGSVLRATPHQEILIGATPHSGTAVIDSSSHSYAPSHRAESFPSRYLPVDEGSGELAVAFRRDGTGLEYGHPGGSPNPSLTAPPLTVGAAGPAPPLHGSGSDSSATSSRVRAEEAACPTVMHEEDSISPHDDAPCLPRLEQAVDSVGAHISVSPPPALFRNTSPGTANLASYTSRSASATSSSPMADAQARSMAAMFAALTTATQRLHSKQATAAFLTNPTFDTDSRADEETEGRSVGKMDQLRLSLSVSNPLVYEDLPSSEISSSQQLNAAVQPPPNLQLAYPLRSHSLTENFNHFLPSCRSPVSTSPTYSLTKVNSADNIFGNSSSSLLPPMLMFTARGGGDPGVALGAAAAEAVRELNGSNCGVDEERNMDEGEHRSHPAAMQPTPTVLEPVACARSLCDSDASNLVASSNSDISALNIEGVQVANVGERRSADEVAHPLSWPSAPRSHRASPSSASKASADQQAETEHAGGNCKGEEEEKDVVSSALGVASAAANDTTSTDRASATVVATTDPPAVLAFLRVPAGHREVGDAMHMAGPEWNSRSPLMSTNTHRDRGEDGAISAESDDMSGTATTRAPNSSTSSRHQIHQVGSMNFCETPDMLPDAGSTYPHSRRDPTSNYTARSFISGVLAASHAAPGALGAHGQMTSQPSSATATAASSNLCAPISARVWSDDSATMATADPLRPRSEEATQKPRESPIVSHGFRQLTPILTPRLSTASDEKGGSHVRRAADAATLLDVDDKDETNPLSGGPSTANLSGTMSYIPSSPAQPQQMPTFQDPHTNATADALGGSVSLSNQGDEDSMWGEPTTSAQPQQHPEQQKRPPVEEEFTEPAAAPVASSNGKHVRFAMPSETQFIDPPSSPWAGNDFFYDPDYTHMEFKNLPRATTAQEKATENDDENEKVVAEDAEVLRAVPQFRFTHRCTDAYGAPTLNSAAGTRMPPEAIWLRGARTEKLKAMKNAAAATAGGAPPERSAQQNGEHEAAVSATSHSDGTEGERAPRIFFTKERLASRTALMEARRAALQGRSNINASSSITVKPGEPTARPGSGLLSSPCSSAAGDTAAGQSTRAGSSVGLCTPPPAAATISVALPDFVAPMTSGSSSRIVGLLSRGPPPVESGPTPIAPASVNSAAGIGNDNDDGFGGWVQQSPAPQPAKEAGAAPFKLTKEWCAEAAADVKKRCSKCPPCDASAAIAISPARVVDVLRTVFGRDDPLTPSSPHSKAADTSTHIASKRQRVSDAPEVLGSATSAALPESGEIRGVEGVLKALSFASLTQRNDPAAATGPLTATPGTTTTSTCSAPVIEDSGYVVPWRTHMNVTTAANATQRAMNGAAAAEAAGQGNDSNSNTAAAEGGDQEDASLRLAHHLLFASHQEMGARCDNETTPTAAVSCQISSFMGTRRLPDARTAAQWTERDVLLAVQQEHRRIAQENEGVTGTERLEDVLRLSS
ncbi:hypothetical protein ABL78_4594 [Leptomonas seymouri]|uniref:Uncharacterized protein n=1 Tax=Leptomonas seymouri TaxID=5684 RepID=A0A0N1IKJ9_LEPSE|nr:hypothetical protein ABL78_4594 [Leptomonas seymouri]|eukprot:KPI86328.1 hypothetical protein ABL78_4594 [Leptomonas seymouri]